jgi:hypothetical protein
MSNQPQPKQSLWDREIGTRGKLIIYLLLAVFALSPILSAMIVSTLVFRGLRLETTHLIASAGYSLSKTAHKCCGRL